MENNNDGLTIQYSEEMTLKEMVEKVNDKNDALMTGFGAFMQQQVGLVLKKMDDGFREVKAEISTIKSDITTMKSDITNLKSDVSTMKSDIAEIKQILNELKKK